MTQLFNGDEAMAAPVAQLRCKHDSSLNYLFKLITENSSYALSDHNKIMLLLPNCRGEVVVSAGNEEAITCNSYSMPSRCVYRIHEGMC